MYRGDGCSTASRAAICAGTAWTAGFSKRAMAAQRGERERERERETERERERERREREREGL